MPSVKNLVRELRILLRNILYIVFLILFILIQQTRNILSFINIFGRLTKPSFEYEFRREELQTARYLLFW